jgi:hypothetical protein
VLAEEGTENVREQLGLAQLAADDEAGVELGARDLDELGTPLLTTRAAASWEAPILSPTRRFAALRAGRRLRLLRLGSFRLLRARLLRLALERKIALQERLLSFFSFFSFGSGAAPSAAAASASASASDPRA